MSDYAVWNSTIKRRTPLKSKGGSRFPKHRQPKFWAWMGKLAKSGDVRCENDGPDCNYWPVGYPERAHLSPRSQGGDDKGNTVFLCTACHRRQEKRADEFIAETGIDLYERARRWGKLFGGQAPDFVDLS